MHAAKELNHSDAPFIYRFFKTIVAQAPDKFDRSQTDQIFYATRHAKLTFRPKFHISSSRIQRRNNLLRSKVRCSMYLLS